MPLDLTLETRLNGAVTTVADMTTATASFDTSSRKTFTNGAGADQADMIWSDERTVATGATDILDVAGSLTGLLGGTLALARVKGVRLRNSQASGVANTTALTLTRPASNGVPIFDAVSNSITIAPGGEILLSNPSAAGWVVTAATADLIHVINASGASNVYRIEIWGSTT